MADQLGVRYEKVIGWMDRYPDDQLEVVVLETKEGQVIRLSDTHNVFTWRDGRTVPVFAR